MKLPIITIPNPILRKKSTRIPVITADLLNLAQNMLETMKLDGVGLAASQIGQNIRLCVLGNEKSDKDESAFSNRILFNPKIVFRTKKIDKDLEGCLSIPGINGVVERPASVTVVYTDEKSETISTRMTDLEARAIQHEIGHLDGVLFTDRLTKYRVVFFGTPEFALMPLEHLTTHPQFNVVGVVTETDKEAGRGHKITTSPIKQLAITKNIPVMQPRSFNVNHSDQSIASEARRTTDTLQQLKPDFIVVAAYGKILPQIVLDIAKFAPLNIHPSLLPLHRGPDPIRSAILSGDAETGVSIMIMVSEMDAGPVLFMAKNKIASTDDYATLSMRLSKLGAIILIHSLENIIADKAKISEQDHKYATYSHKYTNIDREIDWNKSPEQIHNQIRAFAPKIGVVTRFNNQDVIILGSQLDDGKLVIKSVKLPGKNRMDLTDLNNGYRKLYDELQVKLETINQ